MANELLVWDELGWEISGTIQFENLMIRKIRKEVGNKNFLGRLQLQPNHEFVNSNYKWQQVIVATS